MSRLPKDLRKDRALRNAALEIFKTDLVQSKAEFSAKGFGKRVADRLGEGARDIAEEAVDIASNNGGKIGALATALGLVIFRVPLLNWIETKLGESDTDLQSETDTEFPEQETITEQAKSDVE